MREKGLWKKLLSILFVLGMAIVLLPRMILTVYAAEFTTLQEGDVLNVGDTINSDTEYYVEGLGSYLNPFYKPYTLVRADVSSSYVEPNYKMVVTESDTGAYYLFKFKINNNDDYLGASINRNTGDLQRYWPATATSDGISVTSVVTGGYYPVVTFAVHEPPHTHSFDYVANGATITATCSAADCTLPEVEGKHIATLTIAAPLHTTYGDGKDATAVITDANSIQGDAKVQYQKKTDGSYGTTTETAPTDAGDYKASITVGGATASVEYSIAKADPIPRDNLTATAKYGQKLGEASLVIPLDPTPTPGEWTWIDADVSVGSIGQHTFYINFTPEDTNNYNSLTNKPVTVTVGKGENPATVNPNAFVKTGRVEIDLSANVALNGATGVVDYFFPYPTQTIGCQLNGSTLTSGTEIGTVYVAVQVEADDLYKESETRLIAVTVANKNQQIITADDITVAFGDIGTRVSATTNGDGKLSYAITEEDKEYIEINSSTGELTIKKIGSATVIVTATETDSYLSARKEVAVTIAEAPIKAVEGNGFVWHKGSSDNSSIRFSSGTPDLASENALISVAVDGTLLKKGTQYETAPGSVYVKFSKSYLETLGVGTHNVVAKFNSYSSEVKATFTVAEKTSSGGGSTPKKDNVVTCQMAGFPANYAWNEAAKACQPGYLDANGVFHSTTRAGVPNTYDKGIMGSLISLVTASVIAFVASLLLRITDR